MHEFYAKEFHDMAVTIKDVAALAGVSPSTVSRVCNDNPSISKETADRVRRAMLELGYEPGTGVNTQQNTGLHFVGVVYPPSKTANYENAFYTEAIRGISQYCNPRGVGITLISSNNTDEALNIIKAQVAGGQTDGFILLYSKQDDPVVDYFLEQGILYVMVGTPGQMQSQTINIDNDNLSAARDATDYLYSLGHRNIGYLSTDTTYRFAQERKAGYQLSMLQHELPIRLEYCAEVRDFFSEGVQQLQAMLQRPDRPTAILVADDVLALVLEQASLRMGLSIPDDISIVAFNNSIYTRLTTPALTCVDVNSVQLGYEAASQILNHVENPNLMATKIIVPHCIVERSSCKQIEVK